LVPLWCLRARPRPPPGAFTPRLCFARSQPHDRGARARQLGALPRKHLDHRLRVRASAGLWGPPEGYRLRETELSLGSYRCACGGRTPGVCQHGLRCRVAAAPVAQAAAGPTVRTWRRSRAPRRRPARNQPCSCTRNQKRRGWDSNPRGSLTRPHDFQSCTLSRSVTSPERMSSLGGQTPRGAQARLGVRPQEAPLAALALHRV
jgi:hypothetical protein